MFFHFISDRALRQLEPLLSLVSLHNIQMMLTDIAVPTQGIYGRFYYCQAESARFRLLAWVKERRLDPFMH
jgi:hypothetical protein